MLTSMLIYVLSLETYVNICLWIYGTSCQQVCIILVIGCSPCCFPRRFPNVCMLTSFLLEQRFTHRETFWFLSLRVRVMDISLITRVLNIKFERELVVFTIQYYLIFSHFQFITSTFSLTVLCFLPQHPVLVNIYREVISSYWCRSSWKRELRLSW